MARSCALLVALAFPLALVTPPHALAKEGEPDDPPAEIVDPPPSGPLALPAIVPSEPLGYLGGRASVDHSGDLTWGLALWGPPGRNGQKPDLGLAYSARGGDTLLGVGFALSGLPEIHRCGQSVAVDDVASGVTYGDGDRFCMSSGQRLIVVDGTYGKSGSTYRLERDGFDKIKFYEGNLFSPSWFEVWTKDGQIVTYEALKVGRAEASASSPYELNAVDYVDAVWTLSEIKDRAGNRSRFHFKALAFSEQPNHHTLEYMPERIEYTLRPGDVYGKREVKFVYEDRPDPSFAFVSGVRFQQTKRLKAIELYAPNPSAKELVGTYEFAYESSVSTGRSLLHTISRCDAEGVCLWGKRFEWQNAARPDYEIIDLGLPEFPNDYFVFERDTGIVVFDADGDGKDEILYRIGYDYFLRRMGAGKTPLGERIWIDPVETAIPFGVGFENIVLSQTRPVDTDGDGASELWAAQMGPGYGYHMFGWDKATGQPASLGTMFATSVLQAGNDIFLEAIQFGDLDGDGLADLLHQDTTDLSHPYWNIHRNDGGTFVDPLFPPIDAYCARGARILDGDGDGRAELWTSSTPACTASLTAGLDVNGDVHMEAQPELGFEAKRAVFADLNGDGLRDIVRPASPAGWVRFSTGAGYGPKEELVDGPYPDPNASVAMDQGIQVADLNTDGREDLLAFRFAPSPMIIAYLSNGDGSFYPVELATWPGAFHAMEGFSTSRIGDFNGDALVDIVLVGPDGHLNVLQQKPGQVDVVNAIGDHLVAEHPREVITYAHEWSDKPEPAKCAYPQRCVRHGMPVVREHWTWQGSQVGDYRKALYSYEDPRVDLTGRGFLGFRKVRVRDVDRMSETILEFDHETRVGTVYPYAGLPKVVTQIAPILEEMPASLPATARARVTKVTHDYVLKPLNQSKTHSVHPSAWVSDEWEQDVTIEADRLVMKEDETATALRHREGSSAFDDYGNLTNSEEKTHSGVSRKVERTYDIRPADWLISLPQTIKVTSAKSGDPAPIPRETHYVHDDDGFLEAVKVEPFADPHQRLTTTFERNGDGMITQVTWDAYGEPARHLSITYEDEEGIFANQIADDLGFTEVYVHHPAYGLLAASADVSGVVTRRQYDGFGRLRRIETDGSGGVDLGLSVNIEDGWVRGLVEHAHSDAGDEAYVILDELGRTVEQASRGFDGQWAHSAVTYDRLGRLVAATRPTFGAISPDKTTLRFDTLDRLLERKEPDGARVKHEHSFLEVRSWDATDRERFIVLDVDGRVVQSTNLLDGQEVSTTYVYGPFDQIEQVIDDEGNVTTLQYDQRGRRSVLADPDRGMTVSQYNGFDELVWEENALGLTQLHRDVLGRVHTREDTDGITTFTWDQGEQVQGARGKLVATTSPDDVKTEFVYDSYGRPWVSKWMIDGATYAVETSYDPQGRLARIDYPEVPNRARFAVAYSYNAFNYLDAIEDPAAAGKPFWTVQERNAEGALAKALAGNGLVETRSYYPLTGRLDVAQVVKEQNGQPVDVDKLKHTYFANGNLEQRIDSVTGRTETFDFDDLDRLSLWKVETGSGARETSYHYDDLGNLRKVYVNSQLTEDNGYGVNAGPHALTSTLGGGTYKYDLTGRLYEGGGRHVDDYTSFDLPKVVTYEGATTQLGYDAFQRRVRKSSGASSTIYVADLYERREKDSVVEHVFYVPGEAGHTAEVHFDEIKVEETIRYVHRDGLGSVRVVTDGEGEEVERAYFEPFGQRVEHSGVPVAQGYTPEVEVGFTGHRHDDDLGLIDMRGRAFDPGIRRFITPDPLVSFPLFGQSYNRFSYALNNPMRFVDPSGFDPEDNANPVTITVSPRTVGNVASSAKAAPRTQATLVPELRSFNFDKVKALHQRSPSSDGSIAMPATGAIVQPGRPGDATTPAPSGGASAGGPGGGAEPESWRDSDVAQGARGLVTGFGLGALGGSIVGVALIDSGILAPGTKTAQIMRAVGEMAGGLALTYVGMGGTIGGIGLSATGGGAAAGAPLAVASAELVTLGLGSFAIGAKHLEQALSTGSGSGGGNGKKGPVHHIATNKNRISPASGGPWTQRFEVMFKKAGMTLDDAANKVAIPGHQGPHPEAYHEEVYRRLNDATYSLSGDAYSQAFRKELASIRTDAMTPGTFLNKLLTGQ